MINTVFSLHAKVIRNLFLLLFIVLYSCSSVPLTGRKQFVAIPSSQMISLSADSYAQVLKENELSRNQQYISMVNNAGKKLSSAVELYMRENGMAAGVENLDWEFAVIVSDQLNAWCMPGGQIAFYEGILPVCADETGVAVVMGHEIAHAIAQHGNERMSQQLLIEMGGVALSEALKNEKEKTLNLAMLAFGVGSKLGVQLPYSRTHESEADELGLYFMAMAGYDPREAPSFWERMEALGGSRPPEFLSTHPNPDTRISDLKKHMPKALEYYNGIK